jgi:hypothetical protein
MTSYKDIEHMPEQDRLMGLLFGRRIVKVEMANAGNDFYYDSPEGYITLDDGTVIGLAGNTGGCICGAGDYDLTVLNTVDNAITNVIVEEKPTGDYNYNDDYADGTYRIFVVAEDHNQHLVAEFKGSDGNGYYGTGWWLTVVSP